MEAIVFPSERILEDWERSYAGPCTSQHLAKFEHNFPLKPTTRRNSCLTRIGYNSREHYACHEQENLRCLVCLYDCDLYPNTEKCPTCPRVVHAWCVKIKRSSDEVHCALCKRRGWHIITPMSIAKANGHGVAQLRLDRLCADDVWMGRVARKLEWEEEYEKSEMMQKNADLYDGGSLESDRRLLLHLEIVEPEQMRGLMCPSDKAKETTDNFVSSEIVTVTRNNDNEVKAEDDEWEVI